MTPLMADLALVAVICLAGWGVEKVWKWNRGRQHRDPVEPSYKYRIINGELPPGLSMNEDSGMLSGIPQYGPEFIPPPFSVEMMPTEARDEHE